MAFIYTVYDATTKQMVQRELDEPSYYRLKYGFPASMSDAEVIAEVGRITQAQTTREDGDTLRRTKVLQALSDLKGIDMSNVQTVLDKVTDPNAKLLLTKLIQVVRLLVIHTLQGDD